MKFLGIDACKKGWFAVAFDRQLKGEIGIYADVESLWREFPAGSVTFIDIPIGLSNTGTRECDRLARKILKNRASTIFPAPCRQALRAATFQAACEINQDQTSKKLSIQTWNIIPKIREVDEFLQRVPAARSLWRESHPEICFWALNECQPLKYSKKTPSGIQERLDILTTFVPISEQLYQLALKSYRRNDLARDDILDALVLAISALAASTKIESLPPVPPVDELGLPMQIVYYKNSLISKN